ncbi:hypothetical protein HK098_003169 [Nowakowskiella sp. JEL0407]|nr:hypothetical protein HK098_003169 [Nowakowskiella sp. JEL0407]
MAEYVLHHVPLMAVLGLLEPQIQQQQSSIPSANPQNQSSSESSVTSPSNSSLFLPAAKKNLLNAFTAKNSVSMWDTAGKQGPLFYVLPVEKNHKFPTRKQYNIQSNNSPQLLSPHSTLSPSNASSPLYPDGIMTPLWVKKHREEIPSIIVGCFELMMSDKKDPSSVGGSVTLDLDRERDLILCSEINEKKKHAFERGIKFAVVILLKASQSDLSIEERIAFIRKTCVLDMKSLFLLPVISKDGSVPDFNDFVKSLQMALFESATNYYREHVKRVKRKKQKLPPPKPNPINVVANMNQSLGDELKPLSTLGWNIRYDFKMAVFSEFAQDLEASVKYYSDAYIGLIEMLQGSSKVTPGSPTTDLRPYTARWIEARNLTDSLNLKICRLYLYTDYPILALMQLNRHITNLRYLPEFAGQPTDAMAVHPSVESLSKVPGGGSYDYWSWLIRQYRGFGDLIEIAEAKSGLKVPFPPPGAVPLASMTSAAYNAMTNNSGDNQHDGSVFGPMSASNSTVVVQHAGFYYLIAARCAEERWKRAHYPPTPAEPGMRVRVPSLDALSPTQDEQSTPTEHPSVVIELLTKSYEHFKKHKSSRTTLFIASDIARIYESSAKHDMAFKFFDRIGKTYRKENWTGVLASVLESSIRCATSLGIWSCVIESLVELTSEELTSQPESRIEKWNEIVKIMSTKYAVINTAPGSSVSPRNSVTLAASHSQILNVSVNMDQINSFIGCTVQFKKSNTYVGSAIPFQVTLFGKGETSPPLPIKVTKMLIKFSNPQFNHVLVNEDEGANLNQKVEFIDCKDVISEVVDQNSVVTKRCGLVLHPGFKKVFEGEVQPFEPQDLKITCVEVHFENEVEQGTNSSLVLRFDISERPDDTVSKRNWYILNDEGKVRSTILDGAGELNTLRVIHPQPNLPLKFIHESPALLDEIYSIEVVMTNEEKSDVVAYMDVDFRAGGADPSDATSLLATDPEKLNEIIATYSTNDPPVTARNSQVGMSPPTGNTPPIPASHHNGVTGIELGTIQTGKTATQKFWIAGLKTSGERVLYVTIHYRVIGPVVSPTQGELFFRKNENVRIMFAKPFDVVCEYSQQAGLALENCGVGGLLRPVRQAGGAGNNGIWRNEKWVASVGCKNIGNWALDVQSVELVNEEAISEKQRAVEWKSGQSSTYLYEIDVARDLMLDENEVDVGSLSIVWRRKQQTGEILNLWNQTTLPLPKFELPKEKTRIILDMPASAQVGHLFMAKYQIQNVSLETLELTASIDVADGFVFSGFKSTSLRILPSATKELTYNLLPLVAGRCKIPRLRFAYKAPGGKNSQKAGSPNAPRSATTDASATTPSTSTNQATGEIDEIPIMTVRGNSPKKEGELTMFVFPTAGW